MPLEVKSRELDARLYLALEIVSRGMPCLFGWKVGVHRAMERNPRRYAYIAKHLDIFTNEQYLWIHDHGGLTIFLDEEGGVYPPGKWFEEFTLSRYPQTALPHVDLFCAWGRAQEEVICRERNGIRPEQFVAAGHPKFDLSKPEFGRYFEPLRFDHPLKSQPYLLINTSFATGNNLTPFELALQTATRLGETGQWIYTGEQYREHWEHQRKNVSGFIDGVQRVARRFPETPILLRPHPIENPQVYIDALSGFDNVRVRRAGAVQEDIVGALGVIHHDCTSAIEAAFFGHEPVSFAPNGYHDRSQFLPVQISRPAYSTADLESEVERLLANANGNGDGGCGSVMASHRDKIRPYIANVDFSSAAKLAKTILTRAGDSGLDSDERSLYTSAIRQCADRILDTGKGFLKQFVASAEERAMSAKARSKFPDLRIEEVRERIGRFREVLPDLPKVSVEPVGTKAFFLRSV